MTSLSAQEIYDNFHTHSSGTSGLARGQQCAQQLATNLQDRAVTAQALVNGIQVGWHGSAAEAAAQGLTPFAVNAYQNHQGFGSGQSLLSNQMDAFQTAVSEVQPVPPAPQMQDVLFAVTNGGSNLAPMQAQFAQYNAIQQANVDAYNKYVTASQTNSEVPSIMPVAAPDAPVSVGAAPSASTPTSGSLAGQPRLHSVHAGTAGGPAVARASRPVDVGGGGSVPAPSGVPAPTGPGGSSSSTTPSTSPGVPSGPGSPVGPGGVVGPSGSMPPGGSIGPIGPVVGLGPGMPGDDRDSGLGSRQPGNEVPGLVFGWSPPAEGEFVVGGGASSYGSGVGGGSVFGPRSGATGGWMDEPGEPGTAAGMSGNAAREPAGMGEQAAPQEAQPAFAPIAPGHGIRPEDEHGHRRKSHDDEEPCDEMWGIVDQVAPSVIGANLATPAGQ